MSLDNLKKGAKRWLKALRANNPDARARYLRAFPKGPTAPGLRDIQHALALEHGVSGWAALKERLASPIAAAPNADPLVESFLKHAALDWRVGGSARISLGHTAGRLLRQRPELARANIFTAVVTGDVAEVERLLGEAPEAASREGGPRNWPPLLYLCSARLPATTSADHAVTIARLLLDRGADPNAFYPGGSESIHYTALTCVAGEGEEDAPPHPQREALWQLLLQQGAEPYDNQTMYNTHFRGDVLWWLKLMHARAVGLGRQADWADPNWPMLDMGGYGCGARYLLDIAVRTNNVELADWVLAHGASPNPPAAKDHRFSKRTVLDDALRLGHTAVADVLARYGAPLSAATYEGVEQFAAACFRLDRQQAQSLIDAHPEYLNDPSTMFAAAKRDRDDVVKLLLDLGMPIDIEDAHGTRALHEAAYADAPRVIVLLLECGAEVDHRETRHGNTPLGHAVYGNRRRAIALLAPVSRDMFELVWSGQVARVRELLREAPQLARIVSDGHSPLMWLPDDDDDAMTIARLLLDCGADSTLKSNDGETAADRADKRGMVEVAALLRSTADRRAALTLKDYEALAEDFLEAYRTGEPRAMRRMWAAAGHMRSWEGARRYMQLDLGKRPLVDGGDVEMSIADMQLLVSRGHGFDNWRELAQHVETLPAGKRVAAKPVRLLSIGDKGALQVEGSERDWDTVIGLMEEKRFPVLHAEGQMTDSVLERISRLDHVVALDLSSSAALTDEGVRHLARMPQLQRLDLTGCSITDRGLVVLRELPELRMFKLVHHGNITDAGTSNLAACHKLERVELMGTSTGDPTVKALTGKPQLSHIFAGSLVTDDGLTFLHDFPVFATWRGGDASMRMTSPEAGPNFLWLNLVSPLTNRGLANLASLEGLFALSLFGIPGMASFEDKDSAMTAAGLRHLVNLPHLGWLGCTSGLCTDEAMRIIGTMRHLRMLMCQDAVAGDAGFEALSRSLSIERIWGRDCRNLRGRGFVAMAAMPALRSLAVSCKHVDDAALATLPRFPALDELTPMEMPDDGYRHVGRCERLEALVLMYCRDTTDVATAHIAGLRRLTRYFASYTRITDRSLEMLSRMASLERIELYGCPEITNAGVAALARLPRLRELEISGPRLTRECVAAFPATVRVAYATAVS